MTGIRDVADRTVRCLVCKTERKASEVFPSYMIRYTCPKDGFPMKEVDG